MRAANTLRPSPLHNSLPLYPPTLTTPTTQPSTHALPIHPLTTYPQLPLSTHNIPLIPLLAKELRTCGPIFLNSISDMPRLIRLICRDFAVGFQYLSMPCWKSHWIFVLKLLPVQLGVAASCSMYLIEFSPKT